MRIAIVGMGMAGAATAAALARRGINAQVYEQAAEIREVGAGIGLWANAIRLLQRLGLGQDLDRVGTPARSSVICNLHGEALYPLNAESFDGVTGYTIHRAELLEALASRVPKDCIHVGMRCVAAAEADDRVRLDFANGASSEFDLVIGADGGRSVVMDAVTEAPPLQFANLAAYRGLAPNTPDLGLTEGRVWTDRKRYVIVFPVSGGTKINLAGFVPTFGAPDSSWFAHGDKDALRAEFDGWDPFLHRIIDAMPETFRWGLYYRDPLPRMASRRIVLVGDAAHAMTPHAGMGAGQAIEDGFALAALLAGASAADVPQRLKLYQDLRHARTSTVQETTRRNIQFMHEDFPLRPGETRPDFPAPTQWMIDYDPELEAEKLLAESLASKPLASGPGK